MAATNEKPSRAKTLERIRAFRLIDDDFMQVCFQENIPCTELVLRIISLLQRASARFFCRQLRVLFNRHRGVRTTGTRCFLPSRPGFARPDSSQSLCLPS